MTTRTRLLLIAILVGLLVWLAPPPADAQFSPVQRSAGTLITSYAVPTLTTACTAANTNETDLWTYTLPASSPAFGADGRGLRITAWGQNAATATVKTWKIYFGAGAFTFTQGSTNNTLSFGAYTIMRANGAAVQMTHGWGSVATSLTTPAAALTAVDTTAAVILRVTAQNGTANLNDACLRGVLVERLQ
jgi:hypothetical protein